MRELLRQLGAVLKELREEIRPEAIAARIDELRIRLEEDPTMKDPNGMCEDWPASLWECPKCGLNWCRTCNPACEECGTKQPAEEEAQ